MWKNKKVSVVFSTYNEKDTVEDYINDFFVTGFVDEVIAVDNNAVKGTKEKIKKTKAKYYYEPKQGIGFGFLRALEESTGDIIVITEVDNTYIPNDIFKLLSYTNDYDLVCGTRTNKKFIKKGANMGLFVRLGNICLARFLTLIFNTKKLTDLGCMYRVIKRESYNKIRKNKMDGRSGFNVDFMLFAVRNKLSFIEIPINYRKRVGRSFGASSNLKAFIIGLKLILIILEHKFNLKKLKG